MNVHELSWFTPSTSNPADAALLADLWINADLKFIVSPTFDIQTICFHICYTHYNVCLSASSHNTMTLINISTLVRSKKGEAMVTGALHRPTCNSLHRLVASYDRTCIFPVD